MSAMVIAMSLAGQNLQPGGKNQAVLFLHDLSPELAWNVLRWTFVRPGPGGLFNKINLPAERCSR